MVKASRSITIGFNTENGGSVSPRDVTLTIRDWVNDAVIPGASVTISGNGFGPLTEVSAANGEVTFLQVPPGSYALAISATGYLANSADSLANDTLTV